MEGTWERVGSRFWRKQQYVPIGRSIKAFREVSTGRSWGWVGSGGHWGEQSRVHFTVKGDVLSAFA